MSTPAKVHETHITITQIGIAELDAGADIRLRISLSCEDFCDLRGKVINLIAPDASEKELALTGFNGAENVADDLVVQVPNEPGSYTWTAVFPEQGSGNILHGKSSASLSFEFKPHGISMAVWDVPSPLVVGSAFTIKVGAKCSADCKLAGKKIEICNQDGVSVATGTLGDVPWSPTGALYWADVGLVAPTTEGFYQWTAKFPQPDLEPRHKEATYTLVFATVKPPECVVTAEVVDSDKAPIANARVILHPYWGDTDEHGVAKVGVTKGHHDLYISASGKQTYQTVVEVASDMAVKAELVDVPTDPEMV